MKIRLPVSWEACGFVDVEADSIEEAMKTFKETSDDIPLPAESNYVDSSFKLSTNDPEIIALYQN